MLAALLPRPTQRILLVDDDRSTRRTLDKSLTGEGYEVTTASPANAIAAADSADLLLLDLGSGFDLLARLAQRPRPPAIVVITARNDMQSTVKAIQLGAFEYLIKPIDLDRLHAVVRRALDSRQVRDQLDAFVRSSDPRVGDILGKSQAIRDVWKQIGAVSTTRAAVLISGESGTGKELVARAIHAASADRDRPFIAVNCTALAPGVLESELFGHVRGAFTGAIADRAGRCELAGRGTLFLDEIAEIPLELQGKLLRIVQERTFERVGDARPVPLEARVIAATHRDLPAMVSRGAFREDLFYRLRVVEIALPPLRERASDIPILVEGLLAKINRELAKDVRYVTPEALARLAAYRWPGNVRELENVLTRAVVLAKADVIDEALLPSSGAAGTGPDLGELATLRDLERRHIARVLVHTDWNKRRSCTILDISRPTLDRKIDEYALHPEQRDQPGQLKRSA